MQFIKSKAKENDSKNYSLIVKHNNLIQGRYYLEASEQKLLYKIFERVQKSGYTSREVSMDFKEFYNEYKGILGKNITRTDFKNLIESLQDKKPYIIKGDEYIRTQWYSIHGKLDLSSVKLIIDEYVFAYIQSLTKDFTGLRLESIYAFKSFHSMRIYELLKQWCNNRSDIAYSLDDLKQYLGVEENAGYKNFTNFNKYVIEKAIKEINEKSELNVHVEKIKEGRTVLGLNFVTIYKPDMIPETKKKSAPSPEVPPTQPEADFYIPEELPLDTKLHKLFKRQFNNYNFQELDYHNILMKASDITCKKDDVTVISGTNYKLFATVLVNQIEAYENEKHAEISLTAEQMEEAEMLNMSPAEYLEFMQETSISDEVAVDSVGQDEPKPRTVEEMLKGYDK